MSGEAVWTLGAIVVSAALLAWIAVGEHRRRRGGLVPRLLASSAAVAGLLLLALQPGCAVRSGRSQAWLLTPGASSLPAGAPGLLLDLRASPRPGATPAPDAGWIGRHHPGLRSVGVLGHGLDRWDWEAIAGEVRWVERSDLSRGFSEADWSRRVRLGEPLIVQGRLVPPEPDRAVALQGPGTAAARTVTAGDGSFELRLLPTDVGRFLYRLGDGDGEEVLDVQVVAPAGTALLWLESSPGFETRELKRWLTGRRSPTAVRSRISRDRHRFELQDLPDLDLRRLDDDLLERFDLIVLDPGAWNELRADERESVIRAIAERGIGALLLPGEGTIPADSPWSRFELRPAGDLEELIVVPEWPGGRGAPALAIPPRELGSGGVVTPLVQDGAGRLLAAARPLGRGTLGISLLEGTYAWVLEGERHIHRRMWWWLLGAVARPEAPPSRFLPPRGPVLLHRPLELTLESDDPAPVAQVVSPAGATRGLPLRQDPQEPRRWRTTFWPEESGWHELRAGDVAGPAFHVPAPGGWETWRQARRHADTDARALLGLPHPAAQSGDPPPVRRALPRLPSLLLFLAGVFFLWIDDRRPRTPGPAGARVPGGGGSLAGVR